MLPDLKSVRTQGRTPMPALRSSGASESKAGFYLVMAYLLFEFGRPQELIPGLKLIPIALGINLLLFLNVLMSGKLDFSRLQTKLWIVLFGVMAIHVPIAVNNFHALMTFKDMVLLFFTYLGITTFVNSTERMLTVMKFWVGVHGFLAIMGIAKGGVGIGAWMGDENDFCMVMNMVVPFAYFLLFSATGFSLRMKYLALLGTYILAAMATVSRGGFIGLASVGVYCWYRSPKKLNALIVVAVAVVFMALLAPEKYWDEITSSTSDETMNEGTGGERLYTWGIGMEMFFYNPIIGVGQSNFPWTFDKYQGSRTFHEKSIAGRQAHSAWVTLVSELGLAGIVLIGGIILQSFRDLRWVARKLALPVVRTAGRQPAQAREDIRVYLARAMEGSLIGFIVSGVFISILWYPSLWIMVALVVALRNISEAQGATTTTPAGTHPLQPWGARLPHFGGGPVSTRS